MKTNETQTSTQPQSTRIKPFFGARSDQAFFSTERATATPFFQPPAATDSTIQAKEATEEADLDSPAVQRMPAFASEIPVEGAVQRQPSQSSQHLATENPRTAALVQAKGNLGGQRQNPTVAQRPNQTGLPDNLKAGIESLSGMSLDHVKVHYNSAQPAQLNALAYAQGSDIHVAPGQERHLPHETWHVVQQKQGKVEPTIHLKGNLNINDDQALEKEADAMGTVALGRPVTRLGEQGHIGAVVPPGNSSAALQEAAGVQEKAIHSADSLKIASIQRLTHREVAIGTRAPAGETIQRKLNMVAGYTEIRAWGAEALALIKSYDDFVAIYNRIQSQIHGVKAEFNDRFAELTQIKLGWENQTIKNDYAIRVAFKQKIDEQIPTAKALEKDIMGAIAKSKEESETQFLEPSQSKPESPLKESPKAVDSPPPEKEKEPVIPTLAPESLKAVDSSPIAKDPVISTSTPESPKAVDSPPKVLTNLERIEQLRIDYGKAKPRLDARALELIKAQTNIVEETEASLSEYGKIWEEPLIDAYKEWKKQAIRVANFSLAGTELVATQALGQDKLTKLAMVVDSSLPTEAQRSWVEDSGLVALAQAKTDFAPALQAQKDKMTPVNQAVEAHGAIKDVPTQGQIQAAKTAKTDYEAGPIALNEVQLAAALNVVNAISPDGIKQAIGVLLKAAEQDPQKNLVLDKTQTTIFQNDKYLKKKPEVVAAIAELVNKQHLVGVARWRNFLKLTNKNNLYMYDFAARVEGFNVHASLFKDTIDNVTDKNVKNTSSADLKEAVLGSGTSGFHLTLEHPSGNNPRAYRGLPDARRNSFPDDAMKPTWATVQPKLETERNTAVARAEARIDEIKDNLGAHERRAPK